MINKKILLNARVCALLLISMMITACASNQTAPINNDPFEPVNRVSYQVTDVFDRAILIPIAEVYVDFTPQPVRKSVTNFFDNILYLNVIANDFLQGKFYQGTQDSLRFLYNSTFGLAGLFDISTPIGMPKHEEDVGQTFAKWGIGQGGYAFVPFLGPNTVRNLPNIAANTVLSPLTYTTAYVFWPAFAIFTINSRANNLEATRIRDEAAVDPYLFTREAYLQRRQYLIYDGNPPANEYEDVFDESFFEE